VRTAQLLKTALRVLSMMLIGFAAAVSGVFGLILFLFGSRPEWGAVFLLSIAVMVTLDPEEIGFEIHRLERMRRGR
jgi:hypothetical protein